MRTVPFLIGSAFLMTLAGCGPSLPKGDAPSAAEATGRTTVPAVDGPSTPLIVDWKPEQRGDLEEAIADGIAVVAFDDKGLRLLKGCRLEGEYGFLPLGKKKDVVRLESAQEVEANLPLGGLGIAGTIGGGFEQGLTLEIALAMVGKRRTTWTDVTAEDLKGKCDGATHYVRAITIGAFAMKTGTREKARAAAEIFGVGASGQDSSSKNVDSSDGSLDACDKASSDSEKPPEGCTSLLRIELEPIAKKGAEGGGEEKEKGAAETKHDVQAGEVAGCAPGFVFVDGKCTKSAGDRPHLCAPDDAQDCVKQCEKGNASSCDRAAVLTLRGKAGPPDQAKVDGYLEKACNGGSASGCANLGLRRLRKDPAAGLQLLEKACNEGDERGCGAAGEAYWFGQGVAKNTQKALRLYTKGCDGGDQIACTNLGVLYSGQEGIPKDEKKALELSKRACFGGVATACGNAGLRYEFGSSVPQDLKMAATLFDRACRMSSSSCIRSGILAQEGLGVPKDDKKAKELYDRTCATRAGGLASVACYVSANLYGGGEPKVDKSALEHTVTIMKPQCDQAVARACTFAGVAELALGKKPAGDADLKKGCDAKDPWACSLQKRLKAK